MTNTDRLAQALLPCPFCGGDAVMNSDPPPGYGWWQVECTKCGLSQAETNSDEQSREAWNTRTALASLAPVEVDAGYAWRPADVETIGVRALQTKGQGDRTAHPWFAKTRELPKRSGCGKP